MSRASRVTLAAATFFATFTIWGVHHLQNQEREVCEPACRQIWCICSDSVDQTMYKGVLRDDARRREKMIQRQQDLDESLRKREIYERAQPVRNGGIGSSEQETSSIAS